MIWWFLTVTRWQQRFMMQKFRCPDPPVIVIEGKKSLLPAGQSTADPRSEWNLKGLFWDFQHKCILPMFPFLPTLAVIPRLHIAKNFCGSILADCFVLTPHNNQLRHCQRNTHSSRVQQTSRLSSYLLQDPCLTLLHVPIFPSQNAAVLLLPSFVEEWCFSNIDDL